MKIKDFEWDEGNVLHLELKHGITPQETEEVIACMPLFRRTRKGHYSAFGRTRAGRLLVVIFGVKPDGYARVITAWDMKKGERRYYKKQIGE
ncbi:MAG TPA: BrnT family toxin [Proteobacteria bacterium]|nr:BrnT family toxin [Pseudomonadota bacterium]